MSLKSMLLSALAALSAAFTLGAAAQLPYGSSVTLEQAQKAAAAAAAEARRNNWFMAIAVVDTAGDLVLLHKMDNTQFGSINIATGKARSAARFKRPTKVLQDLLAKGSEFTYLLSLEGAVLVQGGIPIVMDGKIVGAIGLSGATGPQDVQCAEAGLAALK